MHSVLIVCTANICRSPMAMGLLREYVDYSPEWRIESAGTRAWEDAGPALNTLVILRQRGIDIAGHRSRSVDLQLLREFRLILVMESWHKEALQVEFPSIAGRVYLFSEMVDGQYAIIDPIGRPLAEFEATAQKFESIIAEGFERIASLSAEGGL